MHIWTTLHAILEASIKRFVDNNSGARGLNFSLSIYTLCTYIQEARLDYAISTYVPNHTYWSDAPVHLNVPGTVSANKYTITVAN